MAVMTVKLDVLMAQLQTTPGRELMSEALASASLHLKSAYDLTAFGLPQLINLRAYGLLSGEYQ